MWNRLNIAHKGKVGMTVMNVEILLHVAVAYLNISMVSDYPVLILFTRSLGTLVG
jgi:hypothetical protein